MSFARIWMACLLVLLCVESLAGSARAQGPPPPLVLESVVVEPPDAATDQVVRAVLPLQVGASVDPARLLEARRALEASGAFESVVLYTSRGSRSGQVVLHVGARLASGVRLETGFGHELPTGWYLNLVGLRWSNPLHRGDHLRVGLRTGLRKGGFYGRLEEPRLGGRAFDALLDAAAETEQWHVFEGNDLRRQAVTRGHLRLGTRWHVTRRSEAVLWLGGSSATPDTLLQGVGGAADAYSGELVPPGGTRERYADAILDLHLDARDVGEPWRRGVWAGLQLRGSRMQTGRRFWRVDAQLQGTAPLPARSALAARLRGVYAGPAVPYHLRPIAGGTGSIRGFRDASLSGPLGARALWEASLEWRVPVFPRRSMRPRVTGVLFFDVGDHWNGDGARANVSAGTGYGLRIRVPWINVLSIDVGVPLTPTATDDPFWIHTFLGHSF